MRQTQKLKYGCPMCDERFPTQKQAEKHIRKTDHLKKKPSALTLGQNESLN